MGELMELQSHRNRILIILAIVLAARGAGRLAAQAAAGALRGEVTDPSGAAVTHATVYVLSAAGQTTTVKVNRDGVYEVKGLAAGLYTVTVVAKGFTTFEQPNVRIEAGREQTLNVALQIQKQVQQVTVAGEAAQVSVSPEENASSLVIKGKDLEALSDDPDELQSELEALAGPAAGPNGGQIYIDGFTGGQLPPKSAIREIRINQNPFSAEYDKLGYGRIEILTKPGSDQFHGRFFADGNDSTFNSRNPFARQIPSYHSEFLDGNFGGPLGKKASFFLDGGRRNIQDASVVSAITLDPSLNPALFSQSVFTPRTRTEFSPRLDYQASTNNTLTVRYQYWGNHERNQGIGQFSLPSQAYNVDETEQSIQMSDSQILGARTVNETRFRYLRSHNSQVSLSSAPTLRVIGAFTGGGNSLGTAADQRNSYELQNYTSMSLGKHMVKFGARLRDDDEASRQTANFNGTFIFPSIQAYQAAEQALQKCAAAGQPVCEAGGASQFSLATGRPLVRVQYLDFEPYVEDDWRVRPNLSLSLGLRFETQNHIHDHADFAPRLGLAWGLGRGGRTPSTVLRAGFGIFYDRFTEDLILQAERLNGLTEQQYIVSDPNFFPVIPPLSSLQAIASNRNLPAVYQIDPNLRAPYVTEAAVGLERQLFKNATASVTYVNSHGVHQLLTRNINAPLPGTYDPADPASGVRPFGNIGNLYQYESAGLFNQNELIANFNIRRSRFSLFGFYTLNYADANTAGPSSFPMNQYDLAEDYGPAPYDVHHRVFVGGSWNLPRGFQVFPFVVASSGRPFNITLGQDLNGDSIFNDRPTFATPGASGPNIVATRWGTFNTNPASGGTVIPPNYGIGPGEFTANLRLSKTFGFGPETGGGGGRGGQRVVGHGQGLGGRGLSSGGGWSWGNTSNRKYNLTLGVSARNLFNNVNLAPPIGQLSSPLFGHSNGLLGGFFSSAAANRRIDLQAIFSF